MYVDVDDQGHDGSSRARVYIIMAHKIHTYSLFDAYELYATITATVRQHISTEPQDYFVSDRAERIMDAAQLARSRNIRMKKVT